MGQGCSSELVVQAPNSGEAGASKPRSSGSRSSPALEGVPKNYNPHRRKSVSWFLGLSSAHSGGNRRRIVRLQYLGDVLEFGFQAGEVIVQRQILEKGKE